MAGTASVVPTGREPWAWFEGGDRAGVDECSLSYSGRLAAAWRKDDGTVVVWAVDGASPPTRPTEPIVSLQVDPSLTEVQLAWTYDAARLLNPASDPQASPFTGHNELNEYLLTSSTSKLSVPHGEEALVISTRSHDSGIPRAQAVVLSANPATPENPWSHTSVDLPPFPLPPASGSAAGGGGGGGGGAAFHEKVEPQDNTVRALALTDDGSVVLSTLFAIHDAARAAEPAAALLPTGHSETRAIVDWAVGGDYVAAVLRMEGVDVVHVWVLLKTIGRFALVYREANPGGVGIGAGARVCLSDRFLIVVSKEGGATIEVSKVASKRGLVALAAEQGADGDMSDNDTGSFRSRNSDNPLEASGISHTHRHASKTPGANGGDADSATGRPLARPHDTQGSVRDFDTRSVAFSDTSGVTRAHSITTSIAGTARNEFSSRSVLLEPIAELDRLSSVTHGSNTARHVSKCMRVRVRNRGKPPRSRVVQCDFDTSEAGVTQIPPAVSSVLGGLSGDERPAVRLLCTADAAAIITPEAVTVATFADGKWYTAARRNRILVTSGGCGVQGLPVIFLDRATLVIQALAPVDDLVKLAAHTALATGTMPDISGLVSEEGTGNDGETAANAAKSLYKGWLRAALASGDPAALQAVLVAAGDGLCFEGKTDMAAVAVDWFEQSAQVNRVLLPMLRSTAAFVMRVLATRDGEATEDRARQEQVLQDAMRKMRDILLALRPSDRPALASTAVSDRWTRISDARKRPTTTHEPPSPNRASSDHPSTSESARSFITMQENFGPDSDHDNDADLLHSSRRATSASVPTQADASKVDGPVGLGVSLALPFKLGLNVGSEVSDVKDAFIDLAINHGTNTLLAVVNSCELSEKCWKWIHETAAQGGAADHHLSPLKPRGRPLTPPLKPTPRRLDFVKLRTVLSVLAAQLMLAGSVDRGVRLVRALADSHGEHAWSQYLTAMALHTVSTSVRQWLLDKQGGNLALTDEQTRAGELLCRIEAVLSSSQGSTALPFNEARLRTTIVGGPPIYPESYNPVPAAFHPDTHSEKEAPLELEAANVTDFGLVYAATSPRSRRKKAAGFFVQTALSWAACWPPDIQQLALIDAEALSGDLLRNPAGSAAQPEAHAHALLRWVFEHADVEHARAAFPFIAETLDDQPEAPGDNPSGPPQAAAEVGVLRAMFDAACVRARGPARFADDPSRGLRALAAAGAFARPWHGPAGAGWQSDGFGPAAVACLARGYPSLALVAFADAHQLWAAVRETPAEVLGHSVLLHASWREYAAAKAGSEEAKESLFNMTLLSAAQQLELPVSKRPAPPCTLDDIFARAATPIPGLIALAYCPHHLSTCLSTPPSAPHHLTAATLQYALRGTALAQALFPDGDAPPSDELSPSPELHSFPLDYATPENDTSLTAALQAGYQHTVTFDSVLGPTGALSFPAADSESEDEFSIDDASDRDLKEDITEWAPPGLVVGVERVDEDSGGLGVAYFLKRCRPAAACEAAGLPVDVGGAGGENADRPKGKVLRAVEEACAVAVECYTDDAVVSAAAVLLGLVGEPPPPLLVGVFTLRRIAAYRPDPTDPKPAERAQSLVASIVSDPYHPPADTTPADAAPAVLALLAAATARMEVLRETDAPALGLTEAAFEAAVVSAGAVLRGRAAAGHREFARAKKSIWWLVTEFAATHRLPPYTRHIKSKLQAGDVAGFLVECQAAGLEAAALVGIVGECSDRVDPAVREHLLAAFDPSSGGSTPGAAFAGSGPASALFSTILRAAARAKHEAPCTEGAGFSHAALLLLARAVALRQPLLAVLTTGIVKNVPVLPCLLSWLLANRVDSQKAVKDWAVIAALLEGEAADRNDQLQARLADELRAVANGDLDAAPHLVAERGVRIFMPNTALCHAARLAHVAEQRRWHWIAASVRRMLDAPQRPWETKACNDVARTVVMRAASQHVVPLLSKMEEGGWCPTDHGFCSSAFLRAVSEKYDVGELVTKTPVESVHVLCRARLFDLARIVLEAVATPELSRHVSLSDTLYHTSCAMMHCKGLVNNPTGLALLFSKAVALCDKADIPVSVTAMVLLACTTAVIRFYLPDEEPSAGGVGGVAVSPGTHSSLTPARRVPNASFNAQSASPLNSPRFHGILSPQYHDDGHHHHSHPRHAAAAAAAAAALSLCVVSVRAQIAHLTCVTLLLSTVETLQTHLYPAPDAADQGHSPPASPSPRRLAPASPQKKRAGNPRVTEALATGAAALRAWHKELADVYCHAGRRKSVSDGLAAVTDRVLDAVADAPAVDQINALCREVLPEGLCGRATDLLTWRDPGSAAPPSPPPEGADGGGDGEAVRGLADEELVALAETVARSEVPLSKLPTDLVSALMAELGAAGAKLLAKGRRSVAAITQVLTGLSHLSQSLQARLACEKLAVLAVAAAHTGTNVQYLLDIGPQAAISECLKWTAQGVNAVIPHSVWSQSVAIAKEVSHVFGVTTEDAAAAVSKALIVNCYVPMAVHASENKRVTVMISDYMGMDQPTRAPEGPPGAGKGEAQSVQRLLRAAVAEVFGEEPAGDRTPQFDADPPENAGENAGGDPRREWSAAFRALQTLGDRSVVGGLPAGVPPERRGDERKAGVSVGVTQAHALGLASLCGASGQSLAARHVARAWARIRAAALRRPAGAVDSNLPLPPPSHEPSTPSRGYSSSDRDSLHSPASGRGGSKAGATPVRGKASSCEPPADVGKGEASPDNWVRSVLITPLVASIVHSCWLTDVDYDEEHVSELGLAVQAAVAECTTLHEASAAGPLLLIPVALGRCLDEIIALLLTRETSDALVDIFPRDLRLWGVQQCTVYDQLESKCARSVSCRDVLQLVYTKLELEACLGDMHEAQGHAKIREVLEQCGGSQRGGGKRKHRGGDEVQAALRGQNAYLGRAAAFFRQAGSAFLRAKCYASATRSLSLVDLLSIQERYLVSDLKVIGISQTSARAVLADLTAFKDAEVVANAYGFNNLSEWLFAVYHRVIELGSRGYWEDYHANMPYSADLFKELVFMYNNGYKQRKSEFEALRFVLQDCQEKALIEELDLSRKREKSNRSARSPSQISLAPST
ncbi:hypothetical protein DIPPA_29549 [Diplonema papillatum]|nr:hypothetical protein DIPPA_29549 [Diplonema papillatum]